MIASIIGLAVLLGLFALAVNAGRRHGATTGSMDARSVRRIFQYALLFALFVVVAVGAAELVGRLLGAKAAEWENDSTVLAQSLAFVLVGAPLAAAMAWWTRRMHRANPAETASPLFTAYLTLASLTGLVMAAVAVQAVVFQLIDQSSLNRDAAGQLLAWGALWAGHWVVARRVLDDGRATPHLLLGSLVGLALGAAGLVMTLGTSLDMLLRPGAVVPTIAGLAQSSGLLVAGALVWLRYWATAAARLPRRTLWLAYVLVIGVGGGLIMAIVAASRLLWSVLVWFLGDRLDQTMTQHFDTAAVESAAVVIGGLVWWFHRSVLGEAAVTRSEVRRVYEYLVAGIALVAAAAGVGTILVALIEAATPGVDVGMTTMNTLLAAVTLLVVGVPVWWLHWRSIRAAVTADTTHEVPALTRRIYLVLLFGVAGVAAVVALLVVGNMFFRDLVDSQLSAATLRSMRYGLGVLIASAAVSAYHGAIFRQDNTAGVPGRAVGPRSVVLVGPDDPTLARTVRAATGARVDLWERLDTAPAGPEGQPVPPAWDEESVLEKLHGHDGQDVLVVAGEQGLQVLVVHRKD